MTEIKLTYFDTPRSRGEECRLALHAAGLDFVDERLTFPQWAERKASTPYGSLPVLTVDGRQLAQSNAILRFVGAQHGLHPAEPFEAAQHEALMGAVEDMRVRMGPIIRIKDEAEKKKQRQEAASGYLQEWGAAIEKQIGEGPFLAGAKLSVADIKLFVALHAYTQGTIDYIPADVFAPFPKLTRLALAVQHHPKIADWYAGRGKAKSA